MKPQTTYLEFHQELLEYKLHDKITGNRVSKHIPYWNGLSIQETKAKYILKPFDKQTQT